jgi:hypothetical protein
MAKATAERKTQNEIRNQVFYTVLIHFYNIMDAVFFLLSFAVCLEFMTIEWDEEKKTLRARINVSKKKQYTQAAESMEWGNISSCFSSCYSFVVALKMKLFSYIFFAGF